MPFHSTSLHMSANPLARGTGEGKICKDLITPKIEFKHDLYWMAVIILEKLFVSFSLCSVSFYYSIHVLVA